MILAGGQGSRLKKLTQNNAKPAVPFGGKYRIIDFTLSNCSNSGIDTVGILTQYKPLTLNDHIGIGTHWDLDRDVGGVSLLPPYMTSTGGNWYKGTANAIYQNIHFIDQYNPKYVLILSGDHVYKMDYMKMFNYHKEKKADVTIAVVNVTLEQASSFGIMNTDKDNIITSFDEKPKKPKSTLASMGIYIFTWEKLKQYLIEDGKDKTSDNDFGKDIIPKMLASKEKLYAYPFDGYWKDVGTITSYWEANMYLLKDDNELKLNDDYWKIYSNNPICPPQYIGREAKVKDSIVVDGCIVLGEVTNSVLFPGVFISKDSKVKNSVIMPNTRIESNVIIDKAIIGERCLIKENSVIGKNKEIVVIPDNKEVKGNFNN
ncbi:glucose-1-phosphate adenylyltransferase [Caldisalinibacter kiritimatiensis]|uniref:Glucose-1-phosphate adenylyltransferase n=1 Tax=Caldisalinibacter kiritimatiensis TaxID=1304284 RepID=R1CV73_9FIRM|nr:Glucose-1-phosphate adenylyltransferase [Caldisalinibacter kiritimatiensis]